VNWPIIKLKGKNIIFCVFAWVLIFKCVWMLKLWYYVGILINCLKIKISINTLVENQISAVLIFKLDKLILLHNI